LTRTSSQSLSAVLRWTVGYGYRPWRALIWLLALIGAASLMIEFLPGEAAKYFTPMTGAPTPFIAPLYVLSNVLPFVNFGLQSLGPERCCAGDYRDFRRARMDPGDRRRARLTSS
jgi:hypothetical protein